MSTIISFFFEWNLIFSESSNETSAYCKYFGQTIWNKTVQIPSKKVFKLLKTPQLRIFLVLVFGALGETKTVKDETGQHPKRGPANKQKTRCLD